MILDEIIAHKKEELAETKLRVPFSDLKAKALDAGPTRGFEESLSAKGEIRLIAEVKKASPSKGVIREDFDPVDIAKIYATSGASCISVLTEKKYFQGKLEYLDQIRSAVELPLLRKDFIIEEYQIYEARAAGADALLLIAACLDRGQIQDFLGITAELGLDVLVESHTYKELDRALLAGASLVGVNNRDLSTFSVSLQTTIDLLQDIPDDRTVVSESGIKTRGDVLTLQKAGVDAILVGESLMREKDVGRKVKELLGKD
ncbi:MAG TPA: indole-3-glycerol phosphate synthase TrpC [Nitrospirota bacterium]|nr:indole-3-glycerol phosphate synthase TrpC [Nitrospirota bacterium]